MIARPYVFNEILSDSAASFEHGIDGEVNLEAGKWIISDNSVVNAETCLHLASTTEKHGSRVSNNRFIGCEMTGISVLNQVALSPSGKSSDRYKGNAVVMGGAAGEGIRVEGGNTLLQRKPGQRDVGILEWRGPDAYRGCQPG